MEYINPIWFYLMVAVNGIKIFSVVMILVLVVLISCVAVSAYKECSVVNQDDALRTIKKLIIAAFIFMVIDIVIPSQASVCEMMLSHYIPAEELLEQDTSKFLVNMEKYVEDIINR